MISESTTIKTTRSSYTKIAVQYFLLLFSLVNFSSFLSAQTTIYSTNFGAVANVNPAGWTFSGTDMNISTNTASSGYSGVSGGAYLGEGNSVAFTNTSGTAEPSSQIGTSTATLLVNTTGYSSITVSFGMRKSSAGYNANATYAFEWSIDGSTYTNIPYTEASAGGWGLASGSGLTLPAGANNQPTLYLRWTFIRTGTASNYKMDDFIVSGSSLVVNSPPTISMDVLSTTNYIDGGAVVSPASPFGLSGVINDPTDPASVFGINFSINDAETSLASLIVTEASSNISVVPNANVILTGTGAIRNVKVIPVSVGYSNITITVSDGIVSTSYIIYYAASIASTTPTNTFWHTGMSDASDAIAQDDNFYMSGDDELNVLNVYSRSASGLPFVSYDYTSYLALPDPTKPEVDLEAATNSTAHTNRTYWLGSMSNGKAPSFGDKPNRNRIFATTTSGTGASTAFSFVGYYGNLKAELISWGDANGYNFTASAAAGVDSKTVGGFAAEGMVFGPDNTTLYIGMRAPLVPTSTRTNAVIAPIVNFETWFNDGAPVGSPTFAAPIELNLGGRGLRDLTRLSNGTYIIIAGNPGAAPVTSAIYKWTGNPTDAPILITTSADGILNMEGVMQVNVAGVLSLNKLQVITDGGSEILYADAVEAKDFADLNLRKFRSDNLNSLDLCMSRTGDTTAIVCNSFMWHGTNYTSSSLPTHLFTTSTGCDSVVTLHLTINSLPGSIVTAGGPTTFCSGSSVAFSAPAGDTYQWQLNGNPISGAISNTYTASSAGNYSVLITNSSGCTNTSSSQAVTVNALPSAVVTVSGATTFCSGGSVIFNTAAGDMYQWELNGTPVSGETSNTYTATASGNYSVVVTNSNACTNTSLVETVLVNPLPSAIVTAAGVTSFCSGDSVMLSSSSATTFQWMYNGNPISGATTNMYDALNTGDYSVMISDGTCSATSVNTMVTVYALPTTPVITQSGAVLTSTSASSYQWYYNGNPISGAISSSYTVTANGTYYVVITNANGCEATSASVLITTTGITMTQGQGVDIVNAYPNPYTDFTSVQITVADNSQVIAEVYSLLGEHIQTLVNSELSAGVHSFDFGAKQLGYSSGVYIVKVLINNKMYVTRIIENN